MSSTPLAGRIEPFVTCRVRATCRANKVPHGQVVTPTNLPIHQATTLQVNESTLSGPLGWTGPVDTGMTAILLVLACFPPGASLSVGLGTGRC
jgi:hypothetical protein